MLVDMLINLYNRLRYEMINEKKFINDLCICDFWISFDTSVISLVTKYLQNMFQTLFRTRSYPIGTEGTSQLIGRTTQQPNITTLNSEQMRLNNHMNANNKCSAMRHIPPMPTIPCICYPKYPQKRCDLVKFWHGVHIKHDFIRTQI